MMPIYVLANAPNLADKNYASGLIAYASIFKALSIGNMAHVLGESTCRHWI